MDVIWISREIKRHYFDKQRNPAWQIFSSRISNDLLIDY
jgi:hypothetical protein